MPSRSRISLRGITETRLASSNTTIANAYVQIMPSMQGITSNLASTLTPELEGAGKKGGKSFGGGLLGGLKGPLIGAGAAIAGAMGVKEIVSGLMDIGGQFKDMENTIIVGTGASGEALDSLCNSATEIAKTIPVSFEGAGDIVQDLNTRMGMVGDDLEATGSRVAAVSNMIGESVNLDAVTGTMNAFGVANEDVAGKLDYLFIVSQSTGIGFNDLNSIIEKNAPTMQNLGFSLEETANMAGLLDKAGMDASGTMSKMSKALVTLAEPGQSAEDAFQGVIDEMQGFIDSGDEAAAIDIASKVFGTRGAAQFVGALQSGAFAMDDIKNMALGAGDGIMETAEKTMTLDDRWDLLKNKAADALEPLAGALMDAAMEGVEGLGEVLDAAQPFFDLFKGAIETIVSFVQQNWPTISSIVSFVWSIAQPILTAMGEVIMFVANIVLTVAGFFVNSFTAIGNAVSGAGSIISPIMQGIGSIFSSIWSVISPIFTAFANGIQQFWTNPIQTAKDLIGGAIDAIKGFFNFNISWPHIPMPHFGINPPGWQIGDLLQGKIPELRLDWYAKGGIIDGARIIGVGEAGPEAVVPLTRPNLAPFASAVAAELGGGGSGTVINQNYYVTSNDPDRVTAVVAARTRRAKDY